MNKLNSKLNLIYLVLLTGSIIVIYDGIEIISSQGKSEFSEWSSKSIQSTSQATYALIVLLFLTITYPIVRARIQKKKKNAT